MDEDLESDTKRAFAPGQWLKYECRRIGEGR